MTAFVMGERLPVAAEEVMVALAFRGNRCSLFKSPCFGYHIGGQWRLFDNTSRRSAIDNVMREEVVTHWLPLPAPPACGGKKDEGER